MMLVFETIDGGLMAFPSGEKAEGHCELIDVQNGEYEFFDDEGQRYTHIVTRQTGFFSLEDFSLVPVGTPDIQNVIRLIDKARYFEDKECALPALTN
jgi:hypothetical protein